MRTIVTPAPTPARTSVRFRGWALTLRSHFPPPSKQTSTASEAVLSLVMIGISRTRTEDFGVVETIEWTDRGVVLIDQTVLPVEERYLTLGHATEVADAIRTMKIRGAPAIGVAAAMGMALAAKNCTETHEGRWLKELEKAREMLAATRPTAVNLFWALDRMMVKAREAAALGLEVAAKLLAAEAQAIKTEDIAMNEAMGRHGAELIPMGATVLTHCNAGALATAGFGTALGVIRAAHMAGKDVKVFA